MALGSRDVARLFQTHGPLVYRRALRLLGSKADADEATQEIFSRVCAGAEPPPSDGVVSWLTAVTTNYCLNKLRDSGRRQQLFEQRVAPVAGGGDHADGERALLIAEVRSLIARADPKQAEAALYVYVDGLSQDETAKLIGVSQRTVSNLLARFVAWARAESEPPQAGEIS